MITQRPTHSILFCLQKFGHDGRPVCGRILRLAFWHALCAALIIAGGPLGCRSGGSKMDVREPPAGQVEYDSNQLIMMSADSIGSIVRKRMKKAQDIQAKQSNTDFEGLTPETAAIQHLQDAMRIVLARPDQDGTRAAAFSQLRRELQDLNSLEGVLSSLTKEGIYAIKAPNVSVRRQATYLVILENLIAEIRPEVGLNPGFRTIVTDIRDSDIRLSDKLKSEALLNAMTKPVSPSVTAENLLDKLERDEKKKKK